MRSPFIEWIRLARHALIARLAVDIASARATTANAVSDYCVEAMPVAIATMATDPE